MLVAAAAMAFTSCQKEETAAPETVSATLTMHADVEQTKTYLENNAVLWGKGEAVTLYVGAGETAKFFDSASTDAYDGEALASFTFDIKEVDQADSYALGGIYPVSAAAGINNNDNPKSFKIALPATQKADPGKYDPSAYIMVLKPEAVKELPTEYQASFRRAVALNKITLTNVKEEISTVEITVPETKYLAGRRNFDLTTGESGEVYENGGRTNTIKVISKYPAGTIDVWFTSWGVELAAGQELTVKMTSSSKIYTRTIAARTEGIKFVEGDLNKLTVNMSSAAEEANTDLSGEYLIAAVPESWNLMSGTNGDEYYSRIVSGVTSTAADVKCSDFYSVAEVNDCVWTVEKMGDNYSIKNNTTGKYVSYYGSDNKAYTSEEPVEFILSEKDGVMTVESKAVSDRKLKYNSSSPRFAFYTTDQTPLYFIPWVADTTPRIFVTSEHEQSIGADGGEVKFEYTLTNLPGQSLTVEENSDFVSASVVAGVVTATVSANTTTESRNATLTLKCGEAAPVSVTIIQAGKPAEGVPATITDELIPGLFTATNTTYTNFSGVSVNSTAVYAGNSAKSNAGGIQLRSKDSNSGIVTTTSGGKVKKISVTWESGTTSGRTLDIYGKNTAYTAATELYNSSNQGTKLGSIKCGTSTELVISGDYEFIGLRSNSGAMYLTEIEITWETSGSGGEVTPDQPGEGGGETPTPDPEEPGTGGGEDVYQKYTGDLTEGDYIIVSGTIAMKALVSNSRLSYVEVTPTNDVISSPSADIVWHIAKSGNYWTIYNSSVGKYAASTGAKSKAQLLTSGADDKSLWTVSGTYNFENKANFSAGVNKTLRYNAGYGFACYAASTGSELTLYKKN